MLRRRTATPRTGPVSYLLDYFNRDAGLAAFLVLWLLGMMSLPIQQWIWDAGAVQRGAVTGVLLQTAAVLILLRQVWTVRRIVAVTLGIILFAWAVEWLGSSTGIPFGRYHYTGQLQPQMAGVPWLIPLAWLMMIPPSWAVASYILGDTGARQPWRLAWVSALAFTAWDLFLDPQMVHWGFWTWDQAGGYFGIPWTNFIGWFLAAALLTVLLRPGPVFEPALAWIYGLTWVLQSIALICFWNLPGPGLVGAAGMGAVVLLASLRQRARTA
jgi:uncharacterized membrane protein